MNVSKIIQKWYLENHRELPWRNTSDPYKIWVSEIILQQTRVNQGIGYYIKFIENFPTVFILANSSIDKILKIWQGLGYYSRARNMHLTAKIIVEKYNGLFPQDQKELLKLNGIGDYTSAAISSIAFDKPCAVVDGNVSRVLSRYYGIDIPINSINGKNTFYQLASEILDSKNPGQHNQAIMELGAIICLPRNPLCSECLLSQKCIAFNSGLINLYPQKLKKQTIKNRFFNYLLIKKGTNIFINQRLAGDIWTLLYEFPLIETDESIEFEFLMENKEWKGYFNNTLFNINGISPIFKHKLTHQHIYTRFIEIEVDNDFKLERSLEINLKDIENYAFPKVIDRYLGL
jgi:A/G-specific adenine glycosylase